MFLLYKQKLSFERGVKWCLMCLWSWPGPAAVRHIATAYSPLPFGQLSPCLFCGSRMVASELASGRLRVSVNEAICATACAEVHSVSLPQSWHVFRRLIRLVAQFIGYSWYSWIPGKLQFDTDIVSNVNIWRRFTGRAGFSMVFLSITCYPDIFLGLF